MNRLKRFEPLIDELLIGILFISIGYTLLNQLNNSSLGFLGIISIIWGCFKVFFGLFIYAVYFYSLLFRPDYFVEVQEKRTIRKIKDRIEKDLNANKILKAVHRYHYLINKFPNRANLKFELAEIYLQQDNLIKAGVLLFFKSNRTEIEAKAVESFTNSVGNNSFQILRRTINYKKIDLYFLKTNQIMIEDLINKISIESENRSWMIKNLNSYLVSLNRPLHLKLIEDRRDTLINLAVIILLLVIQIITKR